jgi:MFS family permease
LKSIASSQIIIMEDAFSRTKGVFLACLVLLSTLSQLQRSSTSYAVLSYIAAGSSMLSDTGVSSSDYGVLSAAFLVVYAAFHLPCVSYSQGRLADLLENTRWPVFAASCIISLCTVGTGFAVSLPTLLVPRVVAAFASAVCDTIFMRLIALHFPSKKQGFVTAIFLVACYLGPGLAILTLWASQLMLWRQIYFYVGGASLVCAVIVALSWTEYNYTETDRAAQVKCRQIKVFPELWRVLRENFSISLTVLAFCLQYIVGFTVSYYEPLYMTLQFPSHTLTYSFVSFGALLTVPIGLILVGRLSDWKEETQSPKWRPLICW